MKNFNKTIITLVFTLIFLNTSYCQENQVEDGVFITKDLSFLSTTSKQDSKVAIWPWNGCKEFSITLTTGVGIEIDFTIRNCCVQGACVYAGKQTSLSSLFQNELPKEVNVKGSSEIIFENYRIKIKNGTYYINSKSGEILNLEYIVTLN